MFFGEALGQEGSINPEVKQQNLGIDQGMAAGPPRPERQLQGFHESTRILPAFEVSDTKTNVEFHPGVRVM